MKSYIFIPNDPIASIEAEKITSKIKTAIAEGGVCVLDLPGKMLEVGNGELVSSPMGAESAEQPIKLRSIQPIVAIEYHPEHLLVGRVSVVISDGAITGVSDFVEWEKVGLEKKIEGNA